MTKMTPVIAVPCLIWIAFLERDGTLVKLFVALGFFVVIAVPLAIQKRRRRITNGLLSRSNFSNRPVT